MKVKKNLVEVQVQSLKIKHITCPVHTIDCVVSHYCWQDKVKD